ncbi:venom peptide isomerase heavy chain-like [Melitaea cinxia]|uniref:venom peptide isomerase heavy chain-like n=1 Tax=Melitaea cinxia TaxID=113334 RepID=UPI001E272B24|nr:venom peptide isomerase heavy chain-like [Melitaea cinxia]
MFTSKDHTYAHIFCLRVVKATNVSDYYDDYVPRVVNGWPGQLGDVPYQIAFKALLRRSRIYVTFCGGTIIGPTKILSAAHCFTDNPNFCQRLCGNGGGARTLSHKYAVAGNLRNRGYHSEFDSDTDGQWRKMKKVVYPMTYKFPKDDIAIVFTYKPFVYNNYVNYVPIARRLIDYNGKCLVSGFGRISQKHSSDKLLLAHLTLIPMSKCNRMHRRNMRKFVCTSSKVTDVGKGDSGGPLICMNTGDPNEQPGKGVLVGVVSGHRYHVGSFFTRVSSYYKYIQRNKSSNIEQHTILILTTIYTILPTLIREVTPTRTPCASSSDGSPVSKQIKPPPSISF